ncbi:unnamed protein product [Brachionus calyciflorus]|uniref:WSC domain-containing protein n=1 Tax=Brachionus calyciflorus TaxID=104777 RepID=A0A813WM24_9BILA|nr:unnamed protein product [Brachionus calyciflorus]
MENNLKYFYKSKQSSLSFHGCYSFVDKYSSYTQGFLYNVDMSVQICKEFCFKFAYLWLKKGVECTCSDSLDELRRIDDIKCNLKCSDFQACGSSQEGVFSVYTKEREIKSYHRSDESLISQESNLINSINSLKQALFSSSSTNRPTDQIDNSYNMEKIYSICLKKLNLYFEKLILYLLNRFKNEKLNDDIAVDNLSKKRSNFSSTSSIKSDFEQNDSQNSNISNNLRNYEP